MADLNANLARLAASVAVLTEGISKLPPRVDESAAAQAVSDAADSVDAANAALAAYEAN